MSWFSTGEEGLDGRIDEEDKKRKERQNTVFRFWMPSGKSAYLTFVDDLTNPAGFKTPFVYMEHNLYLNGTWKHWFTCINGLEVEVDGVKSKLECPLCKGGNTPYLAGAFTVIDHTQWKDKNGKNHQDEKKLFVCKSDVLKIMRKAMAKKGTLRGFKVEVTRTSDTSPGTGNQFDFEERNPLPPEVQPYNYLETMKPKTVEELLKLTGNVETQNTDNERVRF